MKKLFCMLLLAAAAAGCSDDDPQAPDPRYTTLPVVSETVYSPATVYAGDEVEVTASVENKYGKFGVALVYVVDEGVSQQAGYVYYPETEGVRSFAATIPAQSAGVKVRFQVQCINDYGVKGLGEIVEYTVFKRPE